MAVDYRPAIYFCREREKIRTRKAAGLPAPWTEDRVLSRFRFCNVLRRDDRTSQWLIKNYYPRIAGPDLWLAAAIARLSNHPPALQALLDHQVALGDASRFDPSAFEAVLSERQSRGDKSFGHAYVIPAVGPAGMPKAASLASIVLPSLIERQAEIRQAIAARSYEAAVTAMAEAHGMGSFLSGQACGDLLYLDGQLSAARDLFTFAPRGPGSQRGLNRLHGLPLAARWRQADFNEALQEMRQVIEAETEVRFDNLLSVQNVCCEVDKLMRTYSGEGAPKLAYRPEVGY